RLGEQVVAPANGRVERLVARRNVARARLQQAEVRVQAIGQVGDVQRAHAAGGQLQRERQAGQASAQARDRRAVVVGQLEVRVRQANALDEQAYGRIVGQPRRQRRVVRWWQLERRDAPGDLAGQAKWFAAGRQDVDAWTGLQQHGEHLGTGVDQ